jgi:hypothetical protein
MSLVKAAGLDTFLIFQKKLQAASCELQVVSVVIEEIQFAPAIFPVACIVSCLAQSHLRLVACSLRLDL